MGLIISKGHQTVLRFYVLALNGKSKKGGFIWKGVSFWTKGARATQIEHPHVHVQSIIPPSPASA